MFNQTFHPEGGGQVETRLLIGSNETIGIIDTKKENNLIVHFTKKIPSDLEEFLRQKLTQQKEQNSV